MSIYTIYKITNKINNMGYVGFDSNWPNRRKSHLDAYKNKKKDSPLYKAMRKYGLDNFEFEILYQSKDGDYTLNVMENKMIIEHNTFINDGWGYNRTLGGDGSLGHIVTKEVRERLQFAQTGKRYSIASRQKMRESQLGKTRTIAMREKVSNAFSKKYEIVTPTGEILIIHGMRRFCRERRLNSGCMIQVAMGKHKHHKQYRCRKIVE
jgi:group I intron endonuclease